MKKILLNLFAVLIPVFSYCQDQAYFMESLDRGLVAIKTTDNKVFLSWRLLANDPSEIIFDIYRNGEKISSLPVDGATNFTDDYIAGASYHIIGKAKGQKDQVSDAVEVWENEYLRIPLVRPAAGADYTYVPNDASVADLDNDGQYELVVKWDPTNAKDNSQRGITGNVYLDAYEFNGQHLWRINLGNNIRAGAHYTQFLVYDFESDGYPQIIVMRLDTF